MNVQSNINLLKPLTSIRGLNNITYAKTSEAINDNSSLKSIDTLLKNKINSSSLPTTGGLNNNSISLAVNFDFRVSNYLKLDNVKQLTPEQLKYLGETNKMEFFRALLPAAKVAEYIYGVPAEVILAQAALESGWAKSTIGGYNIFGIKGSGPAGSIIVKTKEWNGFKYITINDKFALYNNYYEAIMEHGELFHNGYYNKAIKEYAINRDPLRFADNINRIYATDPNYAKKIKEIILNYNLIPLCRFG